MPFSRSLKWLEQFSGKIKEKTGQRETLRTYRLCVPDNHLRHLFEQNDQINHEFKLRKKYSCRKFCHLETKFLKFLEKTYKAEIDNAKKPRFVVSMISSVHKLFLVIRVKFVKSSFLIKDLRTWKSLIKALKFSKKITPSKSKT